MAEGNDQTTTTTAVAAASASAAAATSTTATATKSKTKTNWQEVQDTVSRLASHTGVLAVSIFNAEGDIVTQQMTPAGEALQSSKMKKKEKMSSHNQNKQSSSDDDDTEINNNNNNNVLGNPKLLTKMMKNANLYVQSLSGHTSMNNAAEDNTINVDEEENSSANNSNSKSNSTTVEDISFVRIRTQYDEILIAPKLGYTLVVLQDPSVSSL